MRRTLVIPTALILSALALAGCTAGASSMSDSDRSIPAPAVEGFNEGVDLVDGSAGAEAQAPAADRQVITTGYVTVTVENPMDAAADAISITESSGGRVDGRSETAPTDGNKGSATLTLRLPADSLTATLDKLRELGDVQEVSLNSADVTMETQDLDARITAMRASIDRLLALLQGATDTDSLISLETAISDRQAQLESMESQQRYYADQITLSTVTLNLITERIAPTPEPDNFFSGVIAGWNGFVAFFAGLLVVLGVLLPWIVVGGLIAAGVILWVKRRRRGRDSLHE